MPQAVQIETQSEQQGLTLLRAQRATRRTGRELAFYRTEKALDQGSAPVEPSRKGSPHLGAYSMNAPGFLSALGGDHALRPELFPDVGVIPFAVELGVGQHPARCAFARKPLRRLRANSHNRSTGRVAQSATTGTADPDPPRPPTSTNVSTASVFALDDA